MAGRTGAIAVEKRTVQRASLSTSWTEVGIKDVAMWVSASAVMADATQPIGTES